MPDSLIRSRSVSGYVLRHIIFLIPMVIAILLHSKHGTNVLYTTFVPCLECTKMAITIGIKKIICLDTYPETDFDLIKESGITIEMLDKNRIQYWAKSLLNL